MTLEQAIEYSRADEDPIRRTIGLAGDEGPGSRSTQHDDIYRPW
jgi:hypothetical protein